jgi:transposase InsO family protein
LTVRSNAAVESLFATVKRELEWIYQLRTWRTRSDLTDALLDYIEDFYNPQRIQGNDSATRAL